MSLVKAHRAEWLRLSSWGRPLQSPRAALGQPRLARTPGNVGGPEFRSPGPPPQLPDSPGRQARGQLSSGEITVLAQAMGTPASAWTLPGGI